MGSRAQAQQLWHTGLVAPQHVGTSQTRAHTRVPCFGSQILNHCTTREVPSSLILSSAWSSLILKLSTEFFSSVTVIFSSKIRLVLFYVFYVFVELLILVLFYLPDFVELFTGVLL